MVLHNVVVFHYFLDLNVKEGHPHLSPLLALLSAVCMQVYTFRFIFSNILLTILTQSTLSPVWSIGKMLAFLETRQM